MNFTDPAQLSGQLLKAIQHAVGCVEDGAFGPKTAAAIAAFDGALPMPVRGFDVSHHQSVLLADWFACRKAEGYQFVYVKASEGQTYQDAYFTSNVRNAFKAGLRVGAYHFARPDSAAGDAAAEVANFRAASAAVDDLLTLPPCLDLESRGDADPATKVAEPMTGSALVAWADEFCKALEPDAPTWAQVPILYTGKAFFEAYLPHVTTPLWCARYGGSRLSDPGLSRMWQIWQHSQSDNLDKNVMDPRYWAMLA